MTVKIVDDTTLFSEKLTDRVDMTVKIMAQDIKRVSMSHAPVLDGELKQTAEIEKVRDGRYKIWYDRYGDLEYAAYQERGSRYDGSRKITRHTRAAATIHFLENAGDRIANSAATYLKAHLRKVMR